MRGTTENHRKQLVTTIAKREAIVNNPKADNVRSTDIHAWTDQTSEAPTVSNSALFMDGWISL